MGQSMADYMSKGQQEAEAGNKETHDDAKNLL